MFTILCEPLLVFNRHQPPHLRKLFQSIWFTVAFSEKVEQIFAPQDIHALYWMMAVRETGHRLCLLRRA